MTITTAIDKIDALIWPAFGAAVIQAPLNREARLRFKDRMPRRIQPIPDTGPFLAGRYPWVRILILCRGDIIIAARAGAAARGLNRPDRGRNGKGGNRRKGCQPKNEGRGGGWRDGGRMGRHWCVGSGGQFLSGLCLGDGSGLYNDRLDGIRVKGRQRRRRLHSGQGACQCKNQQRNQQEESITHMNSGLKYIVKPSADELLPHCNELIIFVRRGGRRH